MTKGYVWFIIFLIVNLIGSIVYFVLGMFKNKTRKKLLYIRSIVMVCAPGVGALLFFFSWLLYRIFFREEVDLSDVVFSKDREREIIRTNEEQDRNIVSLEEAIEVTDNTELRSLVMTIAQADVERSLSAISLALNSKDSETAHYAASVLQDTINDFRYEVSREYNEIQKRDETLSERVSYIIRYMNKFLSQKVFGQIEQASLVRQMDDIATILFEEKPEAMTSELIEIVALNLLDIQEYKKCELWADRSMSMYPNTLSSYTVRIKCYFNNGQKEQFFNALDDLKRSPVIIDKETLELIRTFQ